MGEWGLGRTPGGVLQKVLKEGGGLLGVGVDGVS